MLETKPSELNNPEEGFLWDHMAKRLLLLVNNRDLQLNYSDTRIHNKRNKATVYRHKNLEPESINEEMKIPKNIYSHY